MKLFIEVYELIYLNEPIESISIFCINFLEDEFSKVFELSEALEYSIEEQTEEKVIYYNYMTTLKKKFNYWVNNLSIVVEKKYNENPKSPIVNSSRAVYNV